MLKFDVGGGGGGGGGVGGGGGGGAATGGGVGAEDTPPPPPPHADTSRTAGIIALTMTCDFTLRPLIIALTLSIYSQHCSISAWSLWGFMPINRDIWVFDLDNTLYPASANLFALMDVKMGEYVARVEKVDLAEAKQIQKAYFRDHGTTLSGLMARHSIDPEHFLDYVHDIDLDVLTADVGLAASIKSLPGRKLVFTNADSDYGQRVLNRLGLGDVFEAIFDIRDAGYVPKPEAAPYQAFCVRHGVDPARAIMFEDMARNLVPAKAMGMATVWINNGSEQAIHLEDASHIDHETQELAPWLAQYLTKHLNDLRNAA